MAAREEKGREGKAVRQGRRRESSLLTMLERERAVSGPFCKGRRTAWEQGEENRVAAREERARQLGRAGGERAVC